MSSHESSASPGYVVRYFRRCVGHESRLFGRRVDAEALAAQLRADPYCRDVEVRTVGEMGLPIESPT